MTKQEKILYAQKCLSSIWSCPENVFSCDKNIVIKSEEIFFEVVTFGKNAVIRANEQIIDWCAEKFSNVPPEYVMDGENLFLIESKLREYGKKLCGEHIRYMRLLSEKRIEKPFGFTFETYEKERIHELYNDKGFENALGYEPGGEELAIVARKNNEIAAIVAADSNIKGFWQMGIDTVPKYRNHGLAAYIVEKLAIEAEMRNKVPYYATWGANIASTKTVLKAGFTPVWVGYYSENS